MKIALDPYMHRHLSLPELCRKAAELGYDHIELSPRDDFLPWWVRPRAHKERIVEFKKGLRDHGVKVASLLPMYRWASPHEDECKTAVSYWKEVIQVAVELGVDTMNSEFGRGPSPDRGHSANWKCHVTTSSHSSYKGICLFQHSREGRESERSRTKRVDHSPSTGTPSISF